jgi:glycosyltransferase involved in cell wall biosynthesis
MSRLRIALVTYATKARGGVVHTLHLAEALVAAGHAVHIVAVGDPGTGFFRPTAVPHTLLPPPVPADTLEERVFRTVAALATGLAELEPGDFDVVHVQDCIAARAAVQVRDARQAAGMSTPPVIRTVHHVDSFTTPALVECQLRSILDPDHVVVVSEHWRQRLAVEYAVEASVVTNGVDPTRVLELCDVDPAELRRRVAANGSCLLLSVGGIEPRKGSYELVEALANLRATAAPPPILAVVGGLVLVGTVRDAELAGWYAAADAFVLPSSEEGWGLAVLEAQIAGLPVVVSDIPVFQEYLVDGRTALLARAGDSAALAAALRQVMTDPRLRRELAAAGQRAAARFTWSTCAEQHLEIYRRVTAGQESPAT